MKEDVEILLGIMERASGYVRDDILSKNRTRPLPALRWFIGSELMDMGYSATMAAREVGIDHATLLNGRKQMRNIEKKNNWGVEAKIYERFKGLINANRCEEIQSGNPR